ncbi:MAG TPA: M36 family metallopeptidase [Conexibacter sp.]|jgi:subtilisin-like proprotein convertase family protein|nr:M36 family metallopeptidase [Conexibacter sp.]
MGDRPDIGAIIGRGTLALLLALCALTLASSPARAAAAPLRRPAGGRPELDARAGERTPVPAATRAARGALAQRLGLESQVATDPVGGGVRSLVRADGFLSGPRAGDPAAVALAFVRAHAVAFGLTDADLAALRLTRRYRALDGVTHLTWVPVSHGIAAYDSQLSVHVSAAGRVVAASGPPLGGLSIASAAPRLTASEALGVAQGDVGAPAGLPAARTHPGAQRPTTFANGDRASLVALAAPSGDRLAWRLTVAGQGPYLYDEVVDARTGQVLVRHSLTDFASSAHVFFYHPGAAAGGTATQVDLAPWLTSATTLSGTNAHAYADPNDNGNGTDGAPVEVPPSSGTDWEYPQTLVSPGSGQSCSPFGGGICTWDGTTTRSELTNRDQVTTQVFYDVNTFHDWLKQAPIGFDDASGNFEVGGRGASDPLHAETDDSILGANPQVNNANMSTPPDGQSPTMQMYLFDAPFPAVNGGDDASIVFHEYTHGLSNRLIGNGSGLDAAQSGAMGEAWSDWYAMDYLVAHGFATDTGADGEVVVGAYATGDPLHGIRNQALDCSVGSSSPNCGGSANAGHAGGFTYADLGRVGGWDASTPRFEVHDDGEIWSETLWDLRRALGAPLARALITDAMRLSPLAPSFLDERDAILAADQADDGGAHHDQIWQVFAARGMGYGARTTSANATRAVASFATPALASARITAVDDGGGLGDGDLIPEPGEAMHLTIVLTNPGSVSLTHVGTTLTSTTPGVLVGSPQADYGTIAAGDAKQNQTALAITVPSSVGCGTLVALTAHVTSDQGAIDLPLTVALGSGRTTFASTDPAHAIPDGSPASGTTSTVTVPTSGRVDHLRVLMNVSHTFVGDLTASLTSPGGTTIDLLERPGFGPFGSNDHWAGSIMFDDASLSSIQDIGDNSTLSSSFAPDEPLARFAGEDRAGTWTLRVTDSATPDGGTLNGWSIDTEQPACSETGVLPTTATSDASGVGVGGATLNGTRDDGGESTQFQFQYGTTAAYGQTVDAGVTSGPAGAVPVSVAVAGLAPATTYHFRLVALRNGSVVAVGDDRSFTTTSGLGGGGAGGGGGGAGSGSGGGSGSASGGSSSKPAARVVSHLTGRATLDGRGRFAFAFDAIPAGLNGTVRFVLPRRGRVRALTLGGARFTTTNGGHVRVVLTLRGTALRRLRALHRATVTVTIQVGGRTFAAKLTLAAPTPRRTRR